MCIFLFLDFTLLGKKNWPSPKLQNIKLLMVLTTNHWSGNKQELNAKSKQYGIYFTFDFFKCFSLVGKLVDSFLVNFVPFNVDDFKQLMSS